MAWGKFELSTHVQCDLQELRDLIAQWFEVKGVPAREQSKHGSDASRFVAGIG